MKRFLLSIALVASFGTLANTRSPNCDLAVEMAFDFVAHQYEVRPELGILPERSVDAATTYRKVCEVGYKKGKLNDATELDLLMAEIYKKANRKNIQVDEARESIGDMSIILAYKAGFIAGQGNS